MSRRRTPTSPKASAPPSPRTPRRSTTAGPTTSSPPSAPTASCDIPGMGTHEGHDALREAYARMEAAATPAPPRPQHARHRLERPRGHRDQRRGLPPARATPAGRSSSWAATTTRCTPTTAPGGSTAGPPSSCRRRHAVRSQASRSRRLRRRAARAPLAARRDTRLATLAQSANSGITSRANRSICARPASGQPHTR